LIGLTVHIGSIEFGHYVAYTKRGNEWFFFDDESVTQVKESEALSQEAYLVFYRRILQ